MPDSAFARTEAQFLELLDAGARRASLAVDVTRYTMPGVARSPETAAEVAARYSPVEQVWDRRPDALVVTGAEPVAADLADEAFYADLAELFATAVGSGRAVLASCLAAHAALAALDGVRRVRRASKLTGLYVHDVASGHRLTDGLPGTLAVPHSRVNDVDSAVIRRAGYEVLIGSRDAGWCAASRSLGTADLLLVQGDLEYEASTLLREYRRDAARYLTGARPDRPVLPAGCVAPDDVAALEAFHASIVSGGPDPDLLAQLPFDRMAGRALQPWRDGAVQLYANWIDGLGQQSAARHSSHA
jgi:homoserine O-succinyltransferase